MELPRPRARTGTASARRVACGENRTLSGGFLAPGRVAGTRAEKLCGSVDGPWGMITGARAPDNIFVICVPACRVPACPPAGGQLARAPTGRNATRTGFTPCARSPAPPCSCSSSASPDAWSSAAAGELPRGTRHPEHEARGVTIQSERHAQRRLSRRRARHRVPRRVAAGDAFTTLAEAGPPTSATSAPRRPPANTETS